MKVVILAAGLGMRLREITGQDLPKVMVPIGGKPLLLHTIERLKEQGFTDFYLNLHYLPHVITDYFGDGSKFGVSIEYSHEPELLESAGAIKKMEGWLTDDTFLLVYGDEFFNFDLKPIVDFHQKTGAFGTIVVKKTKHVSQSDILELDLTTNRVAATYPRPHTLTELQPNFFTGANIYVWSREVLDFIPPDMKVHLDRQTIPLLLKEGKELFAWPMQPGDILVDIGKPDNYERVKAMFET